VRAAVFRVRAEHVDDTLDRLLPLAPAGIYEREAGPFVELVVPDADVPGAATRELPDDAAERLALLLERPVVGGRFVIRPPTAPASTEPGVEDIVVDRGGAFGTGLHPTTRRCLELLLALEPTGSFADLGCGTGVLAIGAARLGWSPVVGIDYDERSVEAAAHNATLNGVEVETRRADLVAEPPPEADTVVANMPAHVQAAVRDALPRVPRHLVLSGITPREGDTLVAGYAPLGLVERRRFVESDWAAILLTAPEVPLRELPEPRLRVRVPAADVPLLPVPEGPAPKTVAGQLETALPLGGLALSASRELPTGARVALLLAPGAFRLDVRHLEDTLKVSLRNLSPAPIKQLADVGPPRTIVTNHDETITRSTMTNSRMVLRIGSGSSALDAEIVLSALSGLEGDSGGRVTAQAVIRPVQESSGPPPNVST
jgi:ribosomal protein L11 methyltransferase